MESRRPARWSLTSPLSRTILTIVLISGIGFIAAPWATGLLAPTFANFFSGFRSGLRLNDSEIEKDRTQLRTQLQAVTERLLEAQQQLATAEALERLESFTRDRRYQSIYAQVVAYSPDPGIQSVTINRGQRDGVRVGLGAVSGEGFLIGIVRRVTDRTAMILLITDPQARIVAKVKNAAQSRGLVLGEQGLSIRMSFIPKHEPIASGQLIVTSGADQSIPVDVPIGTVGASGPQAGDLFQSASVISPIDIPNLDVVAIIPAT